MQTDTRTILGQTVLVNLDEKHMIDCAECSGHGETEGEHLQNCDVDDCKVCAGNEECRECKSEGLVECEGCDICDELERLDGAVMKDAKRPRLRSRRPSEQHAR